MIFCLTVSIARRLQDPLAEYVRISPRHIGIGMYQHDISVKQLETALDDIVRYFVLCSFLNLFPYNKYVSCC